MVETLCISPRTACYPIPPAIILVCREVSITTLTKTAVPHSEIMDRSVRTLFRLVSKHSTQPVT